MHSLLYGLPGQHCPCGALTTAGTHHCRKCRARVRWHRRKARHDVL